MPKMRCLAKTVAGRRCKCYVHSEGLCWVHFPKPEPVSCCVCIEEIKETVPLDCGHKFCKECIFPWILEKWKNTSCPVCRQPVNEQIINNGINWGYDQFKIFDAYLYKYDMSVLEYTDIYYLAAFHNITRYTYYYGDDFAKMKFNMIAMDPRASDIFYKLRETVTIKKSPFYNKGIIFADVHEFF